MSIRHFIIIALLGLVCYSNYGLATNFSAAQLAEIKELLRQEREKVRAEILAELKAQEQSQQEVKTDAIAAAPLQQTDSMDTLQLTAVNQVKAINIVMPVSALSNLERKDVFNSDIKPKNVTKKQSQIVSEFELNQTTDSGKASFMLSRKISDILPNFPDDKAYYSAFTLKASAPIDKNNNEFINLPSLDGLTNAFDLEFSYSRSYVNDRQRPLDENGQFIPGFITICNLVGIDVLNDEDCETDTVKERLKQINQLNLYPVFSSYFWGPRTWKFSYGIHGKIGTEEFNFFDPSTLMKRDQDENPWVVGVKAKLIPPKFNASLMLEYTHQNAYKAVNTVTACPVTLGTTPTVCVTGSIGAPTQNIKRLLAFEARREFSKPNLGLALKVTHDFENDHTGLELPIYLFEDSEENLNGGIRLGWTNTDSFTAGVFAGREFKLFE